MVDKPRQTTHPFLLRESSVLEEITVQLQMVPRERHSSGTLCTTTPTDGTTTSPTNSTLRLSGVMYINMNKFARRGIAFYLNSHFVYTQEVNDNLVSSRTCKLLRYQMLLALYTN